VGIKQKIRNQRFRQKKYKTEKTKKSIKHKNKKKMKKPLKGFFYFISDKDSFSSDLHTFLLYLWRHM